MPMIDHHDCSIHTLSWVWGHIVRCDDCGRRYHSPAEAQELQAEWERNNAP